MSLQTGTTQPIQPASVEHVVVAAHRDTVACVAEFSFAIDRIQGYHPTRGRPHEFDPSKA